MVGSLARPVGLTAIGGAGGLAMVGIGVHLALTKRVAYSNLDTP